MICHLQSVNKNFLSIICQYCQKEDKGKFENYSTAIYFLEIENYKIKKTYISDNLFNYNSKNDFKDLPKYQILTVDNIET